MSIHADRFAAYRWAREEPISRNRGICTPRVVLNSDGRTTCRTPPPLAQVARFLLLAVTASRERKTPIASSVASTQSIGVSTPFWIT